MPVRVFSLDCETFPVTEREPVPRLVSVAVAHAGGAEVYHREDPNLEAIVRHVLATGIIGANLTFDITVLLRQFPGLLPDVIAAGDAFRLHDVILRDLHIDIALGENSPDRAYTLAAIVERRCSHVLPKADTWRLRYAELDRVPISQWPAEAYQYARDDAVWTLRAFEAQEPFRDYITPAQENARFDLTLFCQTLRGIHTDQAWVERLDQRFLRELDTLATLCMASGLAKYKHKKKRPSPIQCCTKAAQAMLADLAAKGQAKVQYTDPTDSHPNGQVCLSSEALENAGFTPGRYPPGHDLAGQLKPEMHPLEAYRLLKSTRTRHSKIVPVLRHPIVRTNYRACVDSGRTASRGFKADGLYGFWAPSSTNLQNQERDELIRGCLIPPPGCEFVISDFGMLELVTLAQVELDICGRSALADALNAGIDVHAQFGCDMIGIDLADYSKKQHGYARSGGKAWNFGKPGGMGQARFIAWARKVYGVELTPDEEKRHTARWHARYPEHRLFWDWVRTYERDGRYTIRVTRCDHVRGGMRFPDACNTNFQTLGAYVAKRAGWKLFRASFDPASPLFGTYQWIFVHDEFGTVCPIGRGAEVAAEQERLMIEAAGELCPDVRIGVETVISDRGAKP
jgi:hypothetical protein